MKTLQELMTTAAGTQGSLLIEKKIYNTLIKAVDKHLIPRDLAAYVIGPAEIPGSSVDVDLETADSFITTRVAEGAAIPTLEDAFTSINFRPIKYGVRPTISREMLEDSKFNMIDVHLYRAGKEIAENETSLVVTALDGAANTVTGGATVTLANIASAITNLENNDFTATDIVVGTEVLADLRNIDVFTEAQKYGTSEVRETGKIGQIWGMNVWPVSQATGLVTKTSAYVLDRGQAYAIAEKRPLTIERYEDVPFDVTGITVTQRIDVQLLRSSAVSKITST